MRIVAVSDTHARHRDLSVPPGDVLVHAGDFTRRGDMAEVEDVNAWLGELPHQHKVVIAGNHDWCFQTAPFKARALMSNAHYLQDSAVVIDGVKFHGSPWQPWFLDWAFNLPRGEALEEKWSLIPQDTSVLIMHGPPLGYGDETTRGEQVGCADLLRRIEQLKPAVHICGHIHEGAGVRSGGGTTFINASVLDHDYKLRFEARIFDMTTPPST